MTAITPDRPPVANAPCLTAGPWAGQVINVLFAATVLLFLLGLAGLGPIL